MTTLDESYQYCDRLAREKARNFYYGFMLLPRERRLALSAMYAFFRLSDDITDEAGTVEDKRAALDRWRSSLDDALERGAVGDSPIMPAFRDAVGRYAIPAAYFHELLEGSRMDLNTASYETFADLYRYCYRVASTVGLVCLHVFGFDHSPEALEMGEWCGIGFQLTNILRDIEEDALLGRIYLPQEDLRRFQVPPENLGKGVLDEGFCALMQFEADRARAFYEKSRPLRGHVDRGSRPALEGLVSIYRRLLDKIEREGFRVYGRRVKLSKGEKLGLLARAFLLGGRMGRQPSSEPSATA